MSDVNPPRPRDAEKTEAHLSDPITSSIASASPDSIMLLDREGRIRFINHSAPTLTNEQVLGTSYTEAHGVRGILPADALHLQKPYEARELLRTVRLAIETRRT